MQRPPLVIIANTLIFIYSTVVITLVGTHAAPPPGLDCGLRNRWQTLFHLKHAPAIRQIQDAFNCCGLANSRDMAWPFPDKIHKPTACEETYRGRASGCLGAWRAEELQIAGLLMAVIGMVFIWQVRSSEPLIPSHSLEDQDLCILAVRHHRDPHPERVLAPQSRSSAHLPHDRRRETPRASHCHRLHPPVL
jgi:hypothetical protein